MFTLPQPGFWFSDSPPTPNQVRIIWYPGADITVGDGISYQEDILRHGRRERLIQA